MNSSFDFDYSFPEAAGEVAGDVANGMLGVLTGILLLFVLLMIALCVVSYVLGAVGAYRIAKRRGIHNAWLAWIPIGCYWQLGSISDHYQYVAKHRVTKRRTILLVLGIVYFAVAVIYAMLQTSTVLAFNADAGMGNEIGMVAVSLLVSLLYIAMAFAVLIFQYIAYYDLYCSCKPSNAVLFLVLSIVFPVVVPFFVIGCSNRDEGMPPKRPVQPPVQIPYAPNPPAEVPVTPTPEQTPAEPAPQAEEPAAAEEIPMVETELVEEQE